MVITFPKNIKYTKINPLVDFYVKCLRLSKKSESLENVQVTAFKVNPKDYKKLKQLSLKYIEKNFTFLSYKKKKFESSMLLLDLGPRVSSLVKIGTVQIDEESLYV
jgi:hypothetical protein